MFEIDEVRKAYRRRTSQLGPDSALRQNVLDDYRFCAYRLRVLRSSPQPDAALISSVVNRMEAIRERFPGLLEDRVA